MSNTTNEDFDLDNENEGGESGGALRQKLQDALKRAQDAEARANKAEATAAFSSVEGLDFTNPQHQYFRDTYSGKADANEIREAAIKAGFIVDTAAAEKEASNADDIAAETRLNSASQGAAPAGTLDENEQFKEELQKVSSASEYWAKLRAQGIATD